MQKKSQKLYKEAKKYLVGGVNSPIRSFAAVGGKPVFIRSAQGSKILDEDGNEYLDYVGSYGAMILGHAHPRVVAAVKKAVAEGSSYGAPTKNETVLAKIICDAFPSVDKLRLVSSGTEAVMGAINLARAHTSRPKVLRFAGCYHGWVNFPWVTVSYNDLEEAKQVINANYQKIAAIIVEPVAGNNGVIAPKPGFLAGLRKLATKFGIVLIFDEVITGFRVAWGGAQEKYKVPADLTCLGKIVGGGYPIGAYGGKKALMRKVAPEGPVYQAGTLSGNPVAVAAGIQTLRILNEKVVYEKLEQKTKQLCDGFNLPATHVGSMFSFKFESKKQYIDFFWKLFKHGVYFAPAPGEANFISLAHSQDDIETTIKKGGQK